MLDMQLPANVKLISLRKHTASSASKRLKGKEKCKENMQDDSDQQKGLHKENCLATLDIFAGCGGLSEGLQKSGKPLILHTYLSLKIKEVVF